jgi:hypothetical protein
MTIRMMALGLAWVATTGCAKKPEPQVAPGPNCAGDRTLIVRNEAGRPVDVFYGSRDGGGRKRIIGRADAGRSEFSVPSVALTGAVYFGWEDPDPPRSFDAPGAATGAASRGAPGRAPRIDPNRIQMEVICR